MARRRSMFSKPLMALHRQIMQEIPEKIKEVYDVMVKVQEAPHLTHEDMLELFVDPVLHPMCREARNLFTVYDGEEFRLPLLHLSLTQHDRPGDKYFPMPRGTGVTLVPDDDPRVQALKNYSDTHIDLKREYLTLDAAFHKICMDCRSPQQVRYFWPGIVNLLTMCDGEKARATLDKLRHWKPLPNPPTIHPGLRDYLPRATEFIVKAQMMKPLLANRKTELRPVTVWFEGNVAPRFPWVESLDHG